MICTPFTRQASERGVFMRYSYEFKVKCVEIYERGEYPVTPNGITTRKFRDTTRKWKRMVDSLGVGVLQHKTKNKKWNPEEKLVL